MVNIPYLVHGHGSLNTAPYDACQKKKMGSIAIPTDCKHDEHEGRYDHGTHEGVSVCVSVFVFEATLFLRLVWRNQKDH